MSRNIFGLLISAVFLFTPVYASGEEETVPAEKLSFPKSWFAQQDATGNWGGLRDKLDDGGVKISSNFTTDINGNPVGGLQQTATYSGYQDISVALDFEKLLSLEGVALTVTNYLATGRNLSNSVGTVFTIQEIFAPGDYYFGELDLSVSLFDEKLTLEAGRLFAGDVFAASPLWNYYVSSGINDNLNSIPVNIFFPGFNITSWAVRGTYCPTKEWEIRAALYNGDPSVADPDRRGLNFNLDTGHGGLVFSQITYKHNQTPEAKGLPGSACFGGYYTNDKYEEIAFPGRTRRGNYGFYLTLDQMIYKGNWPEYDGPKHLRAGASYAERAKNPHHWQSPIPLDRPKGLTVWGGAYLAPDQDINPQTYQLAGGLIYQGLPPNRNLDVTAICFIMGKFSEKVQEQGAEVVLELNHRFQVGPWFYITPDIQYIINPNGRTDVGDALVLGMEASVDF
ncbi:carbohydrate porin [Candidatus Auribacterota bacterium]